MTEPQIYYTETYNKNICQQEQTCQKCGEPTQKVFLLGQYWSRTHSESFIFCHRCIKHGKTSAQVQSHIMVVVTKSLPHDAIRVIFTPPTLRPRTGQEDLFAAAQKQSKDQEQVIDKTRISGRESFSNSQIGSTQEYKPELLTVRRIDELLGQQKDSTPILPEYKDKVSGYIDQTDV